MADLGVVAMNLFGLDVLSRVVHIATAITLVGGSIFMAIAMIPSLEVIPNEQRAAFVSAVRDRWKRYVHGGIGLFLLSGFYNYFRAIPKHQGDGLYHALLGTKMLLAFVIFFLASVMVGRSAKFESWRQNPSKVLRVMIILAVLIVAMSGFLKIRGWQ